MGRLSQDANDTLNHGFLTLEEQLQDLAKSVKMPVEQVINIWHKTHARNVHGINEWNVYASFFTSNAAEELARLPPGTIGPDQQITQRIRSQCFHLFREQQANYKEILETHDNLMKYSEGPQTLSQRQRGFDRIVDKITNLMDSAAAKYGFESALVMCGSVIHEDAGLGRAHTTSKAQPVRNSCHEFLYCVNQSLSTVLARMLSSN
ncbi:hypothetical protein BJ138DRAFT_1019833 [Hygrophoropsis aurantiaca]|uniref:Uncharacterized protein n=1 Tax=Hygrophoropsis aurantiaca TaxID=72124 RepID=A0ACB7ZTC6_9AGAM|nr:hypothetical protein BJ138DRAFT_1019833 [Hygrophoropsis aurantiaca]